MTSDEMTARDLAAWKELLQRGDYDALEKVAAELRTTNSKYPNGRGRFWRFCWTALKDDFRSMQEEDYERAFQGLNGWLKTKPQSIAVRLSLANVWEKYAFFARGAAPAPNTAEQRLNTFAERSAKASEYLNEVDKLTDRVDNVYRRLRIELSKGLGEKPDVELVYAGLKDDPANLELVHGMAICLLPRWFGEEGELEKFADEVVRRTKADCGELQYTTVAIAAKEFLKSYVLDSHDFDWQRLRQGFRDLERRFPQSREHFNDEAQLAFMAGDLDALYELIQKIGDRPNLKSWKETEISWEELQQRFTRKMMNGEQQLLFLGHADPVLAVESLRDGKVSVSVDWDFGVRLNDLATGQNRGWVWLRGVHGDSASIHPRTGLLAAGSEYDPGIMIYSFGNGRSGELTPSKAKIVETAFSVAGDLLAAADQQGLVVIYDLKTGKIRHNFAADAGREITGLAFSGDAVQLAAISASGELLMFDLTSGKPDVTRKVSERKLRSVAWSGRHQAVGTVDGEVKVLDASTVTEVAVWKTDPLQVASLAFSPDGTALAIGLRAGDDDELVHSPLQLWTFQKEKSPRILAGHKMGVNCVRFTAGGRKLISASNDWTIRLWNVP